MKSIYLIFFFLCGTAGLAQQSRLEEGRALKAEKSISIFFSTDLVAEKLLYLYGTTPFILKIKNKKFIDSLFSDIILQYQKYNFSFDTIDRYFFGQLSENLTIIDQVDISNLLKDPPPLAINKGLGDPCINMDFETADLTGWEMFEGRVISPLNGIVAINQITTPGTLHNIMTAGIDGICGISTINPNGGAYSLMLGDSTVVVGKGQIVKQTFLVSNSNSIFNYSYAVVFQDPGSHLTHQKPFFEVNLYDENGNQIPCGHYKVVASPNLDSNWNWFPGIYPQDSVAGGGYYKDWSTVFVPLTNYIGQNVTIEFRSGDCSLGGHFGYAYIDAECSAPELIAPGTFICGGNSVTLTAPTGAQSYLWNTGETTQTISVNQAGTYSVVVTPIQGSACSVTLTATVANSPDYTLAEFFSNPTTICLGENIQLTDNSSTSNGATIDYWEWDFADGTGVSYQQNPTYLYSSPGIYDVQLKSGWQGGCQDTVSHTIIVEAAPTAGFTSSFECEGTVTQFTDTSTIAVGAITNWDWDFTSDGSIDNTSQNPTNGYSSANTYNATLTVTSAGGCTNSVTLPVVVNPVPNANFNSLNVCEGEVMNFTDQSTISSGAITNWQWDFGDFTGNSNTQNTTYTYSAPGTYNTVLTVTSDSGCVDNISIPAEMYVSPISDFNFADVCDGTAVSFVEASNASGSTINTWNFDFNNDGAVDYSGIATNYSYGGPGTYNINLYVETVDGCNHDTIKTITVFPAPTANFTGQNVCEGNNVTFTESSSSSVSNFAWQFGNGNTSTTQNPVELYTTEGIYNVTLTVSTANNCTNSMTSPVEIYPSPQPQFITSDVCEGTIVNFTDFSNVSNQYTTNAITNWNWDFGVVPTATATGQMTSYTYPTVGTYNVTLDVTTNHSCTNTFIAPVTINPNPVIDFTSPNPDGCTVWCPDFTNNSSVSSGSINSYLWNFGDGVTSTDVAPSHCYTNNTLSNMSFDITLTATSDQGCSTSGTELALIAIYPTPIASFTPTPIEATIYDPEFTFANNSQLNYNNNWNFANLGTSTDINPSYTFSDADAGEYEVCLEVTSQFGCVDDTCQAVYVTGYSNLYVPNTFTPDGDGVNDYFKPITSGYSENEYSFMVFDRWGLLIYASSDINASWDGRYKDLDVQQDTYIWKLKAKDKYTGEQIEQIGHINLLK